MDNRLSFSGEFIFQSLFCGLFLSKKEENLKHSFQNGNQHGSSTFL